MAMDFNFIDRLHGLISTVGLLDYIDILIVTILFYQIYQQIHDTRAITLVKGLMIIVLIKLICDGIHLHAMSWFLEKSVNWLFVALPILFQPELRRALEHLGQGHFLVKSASLLKREDAEAAVGEIVKTAKKLSQTKTALLLSA